MNGHAQRARHSLFAVASLLLWIVLGAAVFAPQAGAAPNTITGRVFFDPNENNTRDAGESGISGVRVVLDLPGGGQKTATTASDGTFRFSGLDNGIHSITLTPPSSTGAPEMIAFQALNGSITPDFGIVPYECRWSGRSAQGPCSLATTQPPITTTPTTRPAPVTTRAPVVTAAPVTTTPPVSGTASIRTEATSAATSATQSPNRTVSTSPAASIPGKTADPAEVATPGSSTASSTPTGSSTDVNDPDQTAQSTVADGDAALGGNVDEDTSETTVFDPDQIVNSKRAPQVGGEELDRPPAGEPVTSGELALGEVSEPTNVIERVPTVYWAIIGIALLAVILTLLIAAPDLTRRSAPVAAEGSGSLLGDHSVGNNSTQDSNWHAD